MFDTVLIANRGAIATRILRSLKQMGIKSVAVYHEEDANSLHVQQADLAVCLGAGSAADTYLNISKIIQAARDTGAQAIHPGYGFLSENQAFVRACEAAGLVFIGPTIEQMALFGLKHSAREAAAKAQVPLVPGSPLLEDLTQAKQWAAQVGYPVMLKSTAGGGGIGMQVCQDETELSQAWDSVRRLGGNYFSNNGVFLEAYIARARHIEVQIFGDGKGLAKALGERDCSAQRRNQKVLEETPAPNLPETQRQQLHATAEALMASVQYRNAGTVEFIYDVDRGAFYFLEVNTRLQVEHGVTEQVWGVDLVNWMIRQAAGELDLAFEHSQLRPQGHAVQARIYAEAPHLDFRPSSGRLTHVHWPEADGTHLRIDTWVEAGIQVPALFDPMIAKVICHSEDRAAALKQLDTSLANSSLYGIDTNLAYVRSLLASVEAISGNLLTRSLASLAYSPACVSVLAGGTQTTLQDYPGRIGYWHVGVPPSGPMDALSFRLANGLLGNPLGAVALEITLNGPSLKFHRASQVAVTGAAIELSLDGAPCPQYQTFWVQPGQILQLGRVTGAGARAYLAVAGGFDCPEYLGSAATFTLGQFGGTGRALATGDTLQLKSAAAAPEATLPPEQRPAIGADWTLRVIPGPHTAPDFFTPADMHTLFSTSWQVHYQSSRTGVRLNGPKPTWARETGGEAGLHPSNIHDNAYAFGSIDFTGDMPVILGVDGPSLGGFVCPATVIAADLWKLGQLKAGDQLRFVAVSHSDAVRLEAQQLHQLSRLNGAEVSLASPPVDPTQLPSPIVQTGQFGPDAYACRLAGDHFLLVELGPLELDIARRFRVHALMLWLERNRLAGLMELTPGVRSLQIHYNSQLLPLTQLLTHLRLAEAELTRAAPSRLPSRKVYLPISWDDEACREAIAKYTASVRPNAPWCPSNLEFIRRINGLTDLAAVKELFFNTDYLVLGLGDVYLGAPLATPLDPRQRLVTTKYNPARTWTAENSVGIGGAYLCVYGMEGPGGYQFVGRTLQMWNTYKATAEFSAPWLLRFFDQIRFYEVSAEELKTIRRDFPQGRYPLCIEPCEFDLAAYQAFLDEHQAGIAAFTAQRQAAFAAELEHWRASGQLTYSSPEDASSESSEAALPEGTRAVESPVAGSLWQLLVKEGDTVAAGQVLAILESMKMELEVTAPAAGQVSKILKQPGQSLGLGQCLLWLKTDA